MAHACKHTRKLAKTLRKQGLIRIKGDISRDEKFTLIPLNRNLEVRRVHMGVGKSYGPTLDWARKTLNYTGK